MHDDNTNMVIRFALGSLVATPGAMDLLAKHKVSPLELIRRHLAGDWGCICPEDALSNETALVHGYRLLSVYTIGDSKVWLMTEGDRSVTTILLPNEY